MKTKTHKALVQQVGKLQWLDGNVTNHQPTGSNVLGQSGLHTFVDDIMDIVEYSSDPWRALHKYLQTGEVEII
jgi:hypothetical protein